MEPLGLTQRTNFVPCDTSGVTRGLRLLTGYWRETYVLAELVHELRQLRLELGADGLEGEAAPRRLRARLLEQLAHEGAVRLLHEHAQGRVQGVVVLLDELSLSAEVYI